MPAMACASATWAAVTLFGDVADHLLAPEVRQHRPLLNYEPFSRVVDRPAILISVS